MPKRTLTSSPSTTKSPKKAKTDVGQSSLDKYFSASLCSVTSRNSKKEGGKAKVESQGRDLMTFKSKTHEDVIDVDLVHGEHSPRSPKADSPAPQGQLDANAKPKPTYFAHSRAAMPAYKSLSVDPLVFILDGEPWPSNTSAPYSFLSHTLATLSQTRSRILIINTLTNALRTILRYHPPSLLPALYLLSNCLSPPYLPTELGLGPSVISKAIQQVSGLTPAALKRLYNTTGDVGDVAFEAKSNIRTLIPHPPLQIITVFNFLITISRAKGQGAARFKQGIVEKLLVAARGEETRFLARTLSMNLRVGAVRTSILIALARAMVLSPPGTLTMPIPTDSPYNATLELLSEVKDVPASIKAKTNSQDGARNEVNEKFSRAESLLRRVFVQHPNYDHIVAALLDVGLDGIAERVPLAVGASQQPSLITEKDSRSKSGIPLHPTLGSPTRSLDEVYDRLGVSPFAAEYKMDGQRSQVHVRRNKDGEVAVQIFSRHLEDMTTKVNL
jgi:DNA ligase 1